MRSEAPRGPVFFQKNRVSRVYTGGALFSGFFGDDSADGYQPEEWIASPVEAIGGTSFKEGVSKIRGTGRYFDDMLRAFPAQMLGGRRDLGILTKILDSAVRLPIQAHPDKAFSRRHFGSEYGKAECWLILATRPGAKVYFGFKEKITKERFKGLIDQNRTDKTALDGLLNEIPVKPGDVFFVPARMAHAIGAGCLILEIQEPTDFTIQPEHWCGEYRLSEEEMYIGLPPDIALEVFDYSVFGASAVEKSRPRSGRTAHSPVYSREELITYADTPCFSVLRHRLTGARIDLTSAPAVFVVSGGEGELLYRAERKKIRRGDCFFLPFSAKGDVKAATEGTLEIVECLPPLS